MKASTRWQDLTAGQQAKANKWTRIDAGKYRLASRWRSRETANWYAGVINANTTGWTATPTLDPSPVYPGRMYIVEILSTPLPPLSAEAQARLAHALSMPTIVTKGR